MRRIAVFSTAGGAGKTTTVVNLAAALCERGHRVLCIDLAPGARLQRAFGQAPRCDLLELVDADRPFAHEVRPTPFAGLFLLTAGVEIDGEEQLRRRGRGFEARMRAAFEALFLEPHDFVVIDCGSAIQRFVTLALSLCDEHIAPIEAAPLSLAALNESLGFADAVREARNPGLAPSRVLVSRWQGEIAARRAVDALHERFPGAPFDVEIPRSEGLIEASAACEPIVAYRESDPAAAAFRKLASELLTATPQVQPQAIAAHG